MTTPSMRLLLALLTPALAALAAAIACGGETSAVTGPGTTGQPCLANGACNAGLTCIDNVCVDLDAGLDASTDSRSDRAVESDGGGCGATGYHDMTDPSCWSTFDMTTVKARARGFAGAAFDGRYVYFVPDASDGLVARYDTQATFTTDGSWSTFDMTTVNMGAKGFRGAAFDGRYVYFVPCLNPSFDGLVARYDTQAAFTTTRRSRR
jgi:hypothetical protein